jgi:hypothetical protein
MSSSPAINTHNDVRFPLTNKILPHFNYEGLTTIHKIAGVIKDLFKVLICCSIIVPFVTATIDLLTKKPVSVIISDGHKTTDNTTNKTGKAYSKFSYICTSYFGAWSTFNAVNFLINPKPAVLYLLSSAIAGISLVATGGYFLATDKS